MHPLDTLIWSALSGPQAAFAEGDGPARRMRADIGPFAAAADASPETIAALGALIPQGGDISLLQPDPPRPPPGVAVAMSALGLQMTISAFSTDARGFQIEPLSERDAPAMLELALLTKPGPFRANTHRLGRFVGIRDQGRLVAMAGERLKIEGFTEISAVCTHPDYRGRGYGATLMRVVGDRLLTEGTTPFLHTYADNAGAIALYRKLGFTARREIVHTVWTRA